MEGEIITRLLGILRKTAEALPDKRKASNRRKYDIPDFLMSAFAVFYFQHPSMLDFQKAMEERERRNNLRTLFGVENIPGADQVRKILDGIEPQGLFPAFDGALETGRDTGVLDDYRVLEGTIPVALDGTWYFSSKEIHCGHCLTITTKKRDGTEDTRYYHEAVCAAIVKPGKPVVVLPLIPEFVRNEDGKEKQDCERNAAKRWLKTHKERYSGLKVTVLGDDLYCCHSVCKEIREAGMNFLLTCKDESHPWIAEQVKYSIPLTHEKTEWNGRSHLVYRYKWVNGIENRAEGETMRVNYLYFEIYNREKGEVTYKSSWITNHEINESNVENMTACARWKIENGHNNVLKNYGYNLKHNFGHGQNYADEIFCLLDLAAFLFHGIQRLIGGKSCAGARQSGRYLLGNAVLPADVGLQFVRALVGFESCPKTERLLMLPACCSTNCTG
jgi:hypothetical protein